MQFLVTVVVAVTVVVVVGLMFALGGQIVKQSSEGDSIRWVIGLYFLTDTMVQSHPGSKSEQKCTKPI